jgi:2-oxoisovalerate dehydrogenase E2 component (dihydrolipoyl transacylase)
MQLLAMPNVGEGVTEGTVTRWLKQEGDRVALDEPVVEVETDKAVVEIPSPYEGVLARIIVPEGETVPIGARLAEFETEAPASPTPAATADGASATPDTAPEAERPASPAAAAVKASDNGARGAGADAFRRARRYSPVVLKLAAEQEIDLALVRGTGIDGRVTRQDVLRYIDNPVLHSAPPPEGAGVVGAAAERRAPATSARAQPSPDRESPGVERAPGAREPSDDADLVPLSATRRTIARRMLESHQQVPVAWMAVEADVTGLVALRERHRESFERTEGVKLTFLPFFVQAVVAALKQHPALNATFTEDAIRRHRRYDIGVAVATDSGLLVPVVRNAGDLSIAGLARELQRLGEAARARQLGVDELRGATFTVDNTGAFGSIISQPIVPPGEAAIITTEVIRRELRPAADGFAVRSVMNLCLSFDHRALDGAEAGAFMAAVRERLEAVTPDSPLV